MIKIFILHLTIGLLLPVAAHSSSPMTVVKESNQKVLKIYEAEEILKKEAEEKVTTIINNVTNFEKISKSTISRFCEKLTASECEEFNSVFQKLLRISSVKRLGRYRADRFDYLEESVDGERAVVKTIAYFNDDQIDLEYHLEISDGEWTIVNYIADDIDTVRNYRKQFRRILKKESFPQLIKRLKKKIASYEKSQ